jgi:hypothetical protein
MMVAVSAWAISPAQAAPAVGERLYVIADSVALGARGSVTAAFPNRSVVMDGVPGISIDAATAVVNARRDVVSADVVVAIGYNEAPSAGTAASLDRLFAALRSAGARRIVLVGLRQDIPPGSSASAVRQHRRLGASFRLMNLHLVAAQSRHHDVELVNWNSISQRPELTYDAVHLRPDGARLWAAAIADAFGGVGGVKADQPVALSGLPSGVVWLKVNVERALDRGFVSVHRCGDAPVTSPISIDAGIASQTVIPAVSDGQVCLTSSVDARITVDVVGVSGEGVRTGAGRVADGRVTPGPISVDGLVAVTALDGTSVQVGACDGSGPTIAVAAASRVSSRLVGVPGGACVTSTAPLVVDRVDTPFGVVAQSQLVTAGIVDTGYNAITLPPLPAGQLGLVRLEADPARTDGAVALVRCGEPLSSSAILIGAWRRSRVDGAALIDTSGSWCVVSSQPLGVQIYLDATVPVVDSTVRRVLSPTRQTIVP